MNDLNKTTDEQKPYEMKVIDKRLKENDIVPASQTNLIMTAIQKGFQAEFIKDMMDLQERFEANEERKAYFDAVASFKAEAPPVKKDKYNKFFDSWYTSLGMLLDTYNPVLGKHGLSISFPTPKQTDTAMTVECRLAHRMGHSDSMSITAPIDQAAIGKASGQRSRNPIQDIKSTFTYLRSATCEAILGVFGTEASAVDDNANLAGIVMANDQQLLDIQTLQKDAKLSDSDFKKRLKVKFKTDNLDELTQTQAIELIKALEVIKND